MEGCRVVALLLSWMLVGSYAVDWSKHGLLPPLPIAAPEAHNPLCRSDSLLLITALQNRTLWAEQMWDSSAKSPVGLLTGTSQQFGNFDECLEVSHPVSSQYCLITITLEVPSGHDSLDPETEYYSPTASVWDKIHYGGSKAKQRLDKARVALCVPSTCEPSDIEDAVREYLRQDNRSMAEVAVEEGGCFQRDDPLYKFTSGDIAFCLVMLAVFLLVTTATVYDVVVYDYDEHSPPANYMQCLSAHRGLRSLLKRDQGVAELDLSSLYGIHVFAFVFIVLGHRFGAYMTTTVINYEDVEYMFRHYWISMWTGHMDLFCDMFFFLSAFLLGVILSIQLDKSYISPLKVYLHRLVRLLPVYATVVFFYATVFYKLGSGPMWNTVIKRESQQCQDYWWVNLLFLNNYLGGEKMCLLQSWYIACDFQLFLGGTLLLLVLSRRPTLGLALSGVGMVVCSLAPFLATYLNRLPAMFTFYKQTWETIRVNELYTSVYVQAHYRGSGYIVGLLAGYTVYKRHTIQLSKTVTWTLLLVGYAVAFMTYWSGSLYTDPSRPYHVLEASLYAALSHTVFALGLSFVLWSHILGTKTVFSEVFSWRGFVPLSKLSYSMYMVHNIPQLAAASSARVPSKFDIYGFISWTLSDLVWGLALSLLMFLYVETPCRYIFKHITSPSSEHRAVKTSEDVKDVKEESDWSYRITNP